MPTLKIPYNNNDLRDAIISVRTSTCSVRNIVLHFNVRSKDIKNAMDRLK